MNRLIKKITVSLVSLGLLLSPILVQARLIIPNPAPDILPDYGPNPNNLIYEIITILLGIAGILAVLFIIIGGFQYILSGANEELAESGKKTLQNAIIGLVIIILSFVMVNVVNSLFG